MGAGERNFCLLRRVEGELGVGETEVEMLLVAVAVGVNLGPVEEMGWSGAWSVRGGG